MLEVTKIRGIQVAVVTPAGSSSTEFDPINSDGRIVGISAVGSQSDANNGLIQVTMEQGSEKPIEKVPVSHLTNKNGIPFLPVNGIEKNGKITITTTSLVDGLNTPVHLIIHYRKD